MAVSVPPRIALLMPPNAWLTRLVPKFERMGPKAPADFRLLLIFWLMPAATELVTYGVIVDASRLAPEFRLNPWGPTTSVPSVEFNVILTADPAREPPKACPADPKKEAPDPCQTWPIVCGIPEEDVCVASCVK